MTTSVTKKRKGMQLEHVMLFLFGLAGMNMFSRYYYFLFASLACFYLRKGSRVRFAFFPFVGLLALAISIVLFSPLTDYTVPGVIKPFTFLLCFVVGAGFRNGSTLSKEDENDYTGVYQLIVSMALGMLAHYMANWLTNLSAYDSRNTIDIWTNTPMAATGQAVIACIPLSLAIACLFVECRTLYKVFAWITIGICLAYNLILSGRTLFLLALLIIGVAFFHRLLEQKKSRVQTVVLAIIAIIAVLILYQSNVFGIRSMVESSPFYERFFMEDSTTELDDDQRMEQKWFYIRNAHRYLFGGAHMHDATGYAHDLYLDTYDEAGIFAFLGVVAYVIHAIWILVKFVKDKTLPFALRQVVLCVSVGMHVMFLVEPILQGGPWLFASFCLLDGCLCNIVRQKAQKTTEVGEHDAHRADQHYHKRQYR